MMNVTLAATTSVLVELVEFATRALLVASVASLALAAFKVRSTSVRLMTWTGVLYTALGMPLLTWMLPPLPIPALRFSHQNTAGQELNEARTYERSPVNRSARDNKIEAKMRVQPAETHPVSASAFPGSSIGVRTSEWLSMSWRVLATGAYVAIALILLARLAIGIVFARRLIRAARTICDRRVVTSLMYHARSCGVRSVPRVADSELISVPVTMGIVRTIILLPSSWRGWDDAKLSAVLAHEVSHVARRDALTQRLSLVHRAVFWFSPLAWWLHRQLTELAEQASDEAALSCGADRNDYARTLLGFFEALHAAPGRVRWQGVSMAKAGQAEQRLERILSWKGAVTMGLKKSVLVAIVALGLPILYLAASVRAANARPQDTKSSQNPTPSAPQAAPMSNADTAAPSPATTSSAPPAANRIVSSDGRVSIAPAASTAPAVTNKIVSIDGHVRIAPVASTAAVAPVAPFAPSSAAPSGATGRSYGRYPYDDEPRFVIVTGNSDSMTMSGSSEDIRHAQKLKKQISGDFIWFERDEKSYIIRDQATIDRARKLWAPQEEVGKKQEALGKQQEALGKQQEELGRKMEQVQVKVPDMTAELDRLKAKLQKLGANATMEQLGDLQSEIGDLQSKIGDIQSQAGDEQSKIGEQMSKLGEQQGKLGEQQGELGRQQGELADQASRQMKDLLDEAIKNGKAQPESQNGGTGML